MKITIFFLVASLFFINCFAQFKLEVYGFAPADVSYSILAGDNTINSDYYFQTWSQMTCNVELCDLGFHLDDYENAFVLIRVNNRNFTGDLKLYNSFGIKKSNSSDRIFFYRFIKQII